MDDISESESRRENSQLQVVLDFSHFDLRLNFASPNQPRFGGLP